MTIGALGGHAVHLVVFGAPVAALLGGIGVQELRARRSEPAAGHRRVGDRLIPRAAAASGLILSAVIHVAVAPEHFRESTAYGVFFAVLALAQIGLAGLVLWRATRWLVGLIAVASAAVIMLWIASRTSGLPIGPERWTAEGVGMLDVVASTAEVITMLACVATLAAVPRRVVAAVRGPGLVS